jgi:hypothetical protein
MLPVQTKSEANYARVCFAVGRCGWFCFEAPVPSDSAGAPAAATEPGSVLAAIQESILHAR